MDENHIQCPLGHLIDLRHFIGFCFWAGMEELKCDLCKTEVENFFNKAWAEE